MLFQMHLSIRATIMVPVALWACNGFLSNVRDTVEPTGVRPYYSQLLTVLYHVIENYGIK